MVSKNSLLKYHFGHSEFRKGQEEIVDSLLSGRDVLCIMPTGAGKSVCYQIPALMLEGITLVISPLISLMKDQVTSLVQNGIPAAYINSSLTPTQYSKVLYNIRSGKYKIIYVAPERLEAPEFIELADELRISLVAVDEAHCVSQWGQDFRPSYLKIVDFIERLEYRPTIGAFTATATNVVKEDIINILKLNDPFRITTGFDRPNLYFSVLRPASKSDKLLELLNERKGKSGIIYCATRKTVEEICDMLNNEGFSATRYHAGLSDAERQYNQDEFVFDRKPVMVATNAFGMGIDKSNVSFVIHYNMPKNIESYYQEAGRAGRDEEKADCILLYSRGDVQTNKFLIEKTDNNPELTPEEQEAVKQKDIERLKQITFYCTTNDCLRAFMLNYFGERNGNYCGNCSNCNTQYETLDITIDAQKILSCIARTGGRYGKVTIIDILRGSKSEKIMRWGLNKQTTYGLMSDYSEKKLRDIVDFLEFEGYIASFGSEYPVLTLTERSGEILREKRELSMKIAKAVEPSAKKEKSGKSGQKLEINTFLFDRLKELRKKIAAEKNVPPYIVFSDAALADMCAKRPTTKEEFASVSGVGKVKLDMYGDIFIELITNYHDSDEAEQSSIRRKTKKAPFRIPAEQFDNFEYSDESISVSDIGRRINALSDVSGMERFTYKNINEWLFGEGLLYWQENDNGHQQAYPTESGLSFGITTEIRQGHDGEYIAVLYNRTAQQMIVEHFRQTCSIENNTEM